MKQILCTITMLICVFVFGSLAEAAPFCLDTSFILRDGDASSFDECMKNPIAYLTKDQALTACPKGTHLPTARQLAVKGKFHGAQGLKPGVARWKTSAINLS